eukprot:638325-Amphidinium_carterae.1
MAWVDWESTMQSSNLPVQRSMQPLGYNLNGRQTKLLEYQDEIEMSPGIGPQPNKTPKKQRTRNNKEINKIAFHSLSVPENTI